MDAPSNIRTEVFATQCLVTWDTQKYVREYQITYSKTQRQSVKLIKVNGEENNVSYKQNFQNNYMVKKTLFITVIITVCSISFSEIFLRNFFISEKKYDLGDYDGVRAM